MPAILTADILVEMEQVLHVVGGPDGVRRYREAWRRFAAASVSLERFESGLPAFIDEVAGLPRTSDPRGCPRVVVTGDFFTRFNPFFMEGVCDLYASHGIILKPVDLGEFLLYRIWHDVAGVAGGWGMKPGAMALAKACSRILRPDGQAYLRQWLAYRAVRQSEDHA